jgi:hypothetical protein
MSAMPVVPSGAHDQFIVSHGKSGAVGVFTSERPLPLRRGGRVLIQTARGMEIGTVLCPATLHQARLLGATSSGTLLRPMTPEDDARRAELAQLAQAIFAAGRAWSARDRAAMEVLDVELLFDAQLAVVQFVGDDADSLSFAQALEQQFGVTIRLENLANPVETPDETKTGCDKPDCGRSAGGSCTSCSSGGGCSSCGSGKVDLRPYFSHLREKMPTQQRIPLA